MNLITAGHPDFLIPAGNWAAWVGALLTAGTLFLLYRAQRAGSRDRASLELRQQMSEARQWALDEDRRFDRESAQAQLIYSYLLDDPEQNRPYGINDRRVLCRLKNASFGPVARITVRWIIVGGPNDGQAGAFDEVALLEPGEERDVPMTTAFSINFRHEMRFDDDSGRRWLKYSPTSGDRNLMRLT